MIDINNTQITHDIKSDEFATIVRGRLCTDMIMTVSKLEQNLSRDIDVIKECSKAIKHDIFHKIYGDIRNELYIIQRDLLISIHPKDCENHYTQEALGKLAQLLRKLQY